MKKVVAWFLIVTFSLTSFAYSTPTPTPVTTTAPTALIQNDNERNGDEDFSQKKLHTFALAEPLLFTFKTEDFATAKWSDLVAAVYTQATDTSYIVSTLKVTGALDQKVILSTAELTTYLEGVSASNASIQETAAKTPDAKFESNYESVYKQTLTFVMENSLVEYGQYSKLDMANKYPDYLDQLAMDYKVYRKNGLYILMYRTFPSLNWTSVIYADKVSAEKGLKGFIEEQEKIQVAVGLKKPPAKVVPPVTKVVPPVKKVVPPLPPNKFYVLIILKNNKYELKEFKTAKEAAAFMTQALKKFGKTNVKYFDSKAKLDAIIKSMKLKK